MSPDYSRFYSDCEHCVDVEQGPDHLDNIEEIVHGVCPNCPPPDLDPPKSRLEPISDTDVAPAAPIVAYARSLRYKARRLIRSLRSTEIEDMKTTDTAGSGQTTSEPNAVPEDEIAGKENINAAHIRDRMRGTRVILTGGMPSASARASRSDSRVINRSEDSIETGEYAMKPAKPRNGAAAKARRIAELAASIAADFSTVREKIDAANRRIADINNFNLADFMRQGVERWTAVVNEAIQECEDNVTRQCMELARIADAQPAT